MIKNMFKSEYPWECNCSAKFVAISSSDKLITSYYSFYFNRYSFVSNFKDKPNVAPTSTTIDLIMPSSEYKQVVTIKKFFSIPINPSTDLLISVFNKVLSLSAFQ